MTGLQSGNIIGKDPPRTNINAKVHIKYCMTLKRQSQGEGHISHCIGHRIWVYLHCDLWPWYYDLGSRSRHTLRSWTINVLNTSIIQIKLGSEELCPRHGFGECVHCDLDLGDLTLGQGHDTPLVMDNKYVKYYQGPTWQWGVLAWTWILSTCALWLWPLRCDLGSRSWHTLGSWTTIVWNIIQIGQVGKKLWPGHIVNRQTGWFLYIPPNFVLGYN